MLNSDVFSSIMQRFGNRTNPVTRAQCVIELNTMIRDTLEGGDELPWFMEKQWESTAVAEQGWLEMPDDFIVEVEERSFKFQNADGRWCRELAKRDFDYVEHHADKMDPAVPEVYALFGTRVYFAAKPKLAYAFKLPYYGHTAAVPDDGNAVTNLWLLEFFNYVTLRTIDLMSRTTIRDEQLTKRVAQPLADARVAFIKRIEARQHTNRDYAEEME